MHLVAAELSDLVAAELSDLVAAELSDLVAAELSDLVAATIVIIHIPHDGLVTRGLLQTLLLAIWKIEIKKVCMGD